MTASGSRPSTWKNALTSYPRVREAAIIGVWHPKWQERPIAILVTEDGQEIAPADLHDVLAGHFAKWQMPDNVFVVDALAQTSVGKLDKKLKRASYEGVFEQRR